MKIVYVEMTLYGTESKRIDLLEFLFLLLWMHDKDKQTREEAAEEIMDRFPGGGAYDAFKDNSVRRVLNNLKKRGFFISGYEEGSYCFALEKKEKQARKALRAYEQKTLADSAYMGGGMHDW